MTDKKIAIVLFNLGGPTGPKTIRPFLMNFFMDKNIIPWPKPLRYLLANFIATLRSNGPAKTAYGEMGGGSPLLENTIAQAKALEKQFDGDVRVYTCMRYWHPMADSVAPQVQAFNPDELILVSLYPQMSSTTFWSSLESWQEVVQQIGYDKKPTVICCYPTMDGFISASVKNIQSEIEKCQQATGKLPRILFSAHSLPVKVIENGDPYEWQCNQTAQAIIKQLNIPNLDAVISYQSKVGPQKWLGPQTEDEIKRAGHDKVPLLVYPHAFVSEHVETIVELGIEYREVAEHHGVPYYGVVKTVGTHPEFIAGLAKLISGFAGRPGIFSHVPDGHAICPAEYGWCCQRRADEQKLFQGCCHQK
jgi:ferrochelatase